MTSRLAPLAAVVSILSLLVWVSFSGSSSTTRDAEPPALQRVSALQEGHRAPAALPALPNACHEPLGWRIGRVDAQFDLDPRDLRAAVEAAASVWEAAAGRPLFTFDSENGFEVHAIYDAGQARLEQRERAEASFREAERRLDARREELGEDDETYQREMEAHRARGEALERTFAPTPVEAGYYREITHEVDGRPVGREREIRIHRFGDEADLLWVIAHELGHALGLEHVSEPGALMGERYGRAAGDVSRPRVGPAELEQFRTLCRELD